LVHKPHYQNDKISITTIMCKPQPPCTPLPSRIYDIKDGNGTRTYNLFAKVLKATDFGLPGSKAIVFESCLKPSSIGNQSQQFYFVAMAISRQSQGSPSRRNNSATSSSGPAHQRHAHPCSRSWIRRKKGVEADEACHFFKMYQVFYVSHVGFFLHL
jgi:hypothetical protein